MKYIMVILFVLFYSGCGKSTYLRLDTVPTGAKLFDMKTGSYLGDAPLEKSIYYSDISKDENIECKNLGGLIAKWQSGATSSIDSSLVCKQPTNQFSIKRPKEYKDLEIDIRYAEFKNNQRREKEKQAEAIANFSKAMNAFADGYNSHQKMILPIPYNYSNNINSPLKRSNSKFYTSPASKNQYKYDLSNPAERLIYSTDMGAQINDSVNYPKVYIDRELGYIGGGINE